MSVTSGFGLDGMFRFLYTEVWRANSIELDGLQARHAEVSLVYPKSPESPL